MWRSYQLYKWTSWNRKMCSSSLQMFSRKCPCILHFLLFSLCLLLKELDYEELKEVRLQVSVSNKAQYHSSVVITESKTYTIQVNVINQPEGPRFKPAVKVITVSEESTTVVLNKVITNYAAIDSDTLLIATNVRWEYKHFAKKNIPLQHTQQCGFIQML